MRVVLACIVAVWLWQTPSADTKKSTDNSSAGQAETAGTTAAPGGAGKATPASVASGKKIYATDCLMCHGKEGAGDGDLAVDMKLTLKDYRDPATLKDISDKEMFEIIDKGKGKMMGEEGRLKPEQISDVVNYVRSLAKKG
ncbi:MAG TPA: c-type cytochrome [Methylomirabilota bacterium]|nr:c-type cytochrome [Methylomirabilota bacterium]